MKKTLIFAALFLVLPLATFAHGAIDDGDNTPKAQKETMNVNMSGGMMDAAGADHGSGGMMGDNMIWMNLLHGLVGITSIVWLIAGILFLYTNFPKKKEKEIQ